MVDSYYGIFHWMANCLHHISATNQQTSGSIPIVGYHSQQLLLHTSTFHPFFFTSTSFVDQVVFKSHKNVFSPKNIFQLFFSAFIFWLRSKRMAFVSNRSDQLHRWTAPMQQLEGRPAAAVLRDDAQGPRVQADPVELHLAAETPS